MSEGPGAYDPLAGLDAVDWASHRHAYGPAVDVPGLLRACTGRTTQPTRSW
ncbi:hypothetical protein [Streptomyces tanashiensis]|uniref:Uncharacterized protein n=1 Tax=Streptomyces tanashiensis TaxID=67367 RepID=A0ABY6R3L6_9ACTN|nr:hypothetical protein [Streptomyces tanashiensis]UZX24658.1 hypothetical protein LDH80_29880 [Streptomyces tanashiensis]